MCVNFNDGSLPVIFHFFFFFNDTATTEIYTLSLHDALPILNWLSTTGYRPLPLGHLDLKPPLGFRAILPVRSEEHTSELQSRQYLVCRLLLEKKKEAPRQIPILCSMSRWMIYARTSYRHTRQ